jgi:NADPH-dependent ferric siderophore reductase
MRRVTLEGDALEGFLSTAPDDGARMYFPADSLDTSWVPTVEGAGLIFPENVPRPPGREYTPRRYDPVAGELDIDFVIHGDGPSSAWAARAVPGHVVGISGPRRSRIVSDAIDWFLLAGDETALPSISRRLEELPAGTRAIAVLEVADAAEEQRINTRADVEIIWLHRDAAHPDPDLQARAVRELGFPSGTVFAWAAGEASSMRALRRHLLNERGIAPDWARITGYWKRAVENYDHHQPLDD